MQTLRNAHLIARFVLVWFALSIGVAIASPVVKPQAIQWVCSGAGSVKAISADAGETASTPAGSNTLDCPLCAGLGTVPPFDPVSFGVAAPRSGVVAVQPAAYFTSVSAAPPPARGPPAFI